MRTRRGTSLVETLVGGVLVAVILGVVAGVCNEYANVVRYSGKRDQAVVALQSALDRVRGELAEATAVQMPTAGEPSASQLTIQRVDPNHASRLPATPSSATTSWNPYAAPYMLTVRFALAGRRLQRHVTFPGGAQDVQVLAEDVESFLVTRLSGTLYRIQVVLEEDRVSRAVSTMGRLRVGL